MAIVTAVIASSCSQSAPILIGNAPMEIQPVVDLASGAGIGADRAVELAAEAALRDAATVSDTSIGRLVTHVPHGDQQEGPIVWLVHWNDAEGQRWICIDATTEQIACDVASRR